MPMRRLKRLGNKGRRLYHRVLYAYNLRLYKDCLDPKLKVKLAGKVSRHAKKAFEATAINSDYPPV